MTGNDNDDKDRAARMAKKNIRLAILLAIIALSIYVGYIIAYY